MAEAKSLQCDICKIQLRSAAEAQDHAEVSGHASFSESTAAVLTLVCSECGKPCRTETEQDLHTKRNPGHTTFIDQTEAAAKKLDSEAEMKKLREDAMDVDGAPAKDSGGFAPGDPAGDELVAPEVDPDLQKQLEEMGFGVNRAIRALHSTGSASIEQCANWCVEHAEDADVDLPLLVPRRSIKKKGPPLTAEEARAVAEELRRSAAAKREKEEKESERLRELERIRAGKELQAARRIEEDQERKRTIDFRRREKEEEARAKEKIRVKLAEDKAARRRKLGLPEEPTAEELAAEEARAKAKADAEAAEREKKAQAGLVIKPVSMAEDLRAALVEIKKAHGAEGDKFQARERAIAAALHPRLPRSALPLFTEALTRGNQEKVACNTLMTYVGNIAKAPGDEKFRKIRLTNAAFQQRVGGLQGGLRFLQAMGFEQDAAGEFLELPAAKAGPVFLNTAGAEINSALTNPFFGVL